MDGRGVKLINKSSKRATTKKDDGEEISDSISISILLAGALAIKELADANKFRAFLKEKSISRRGLLPGMKLLFENLLEDQLLQVRFGAGFTVDDDRITHRALHNGVPIERVRSNSSLAKLIRGLKRARDKVCKETSIPDFHAAISEELSPWFEAIEELFSTLTEIWGTECKHLDKQEVRNLHAFSWFLRFLNISQRLGLPLKDSPIGKERLKRCEARRNRNRLDKCVVGWKTSAAFLWSTLEGVTLPNAPVKLVLQCDSWEDLDNSFRPVADGPVAEADRILGSHMGAIFLATSGCRPKSLESLMVEYDMTKKDERRVLLDHSFLWYDFEILDGAHPKIFPGVSTFINLLLGTVFQKKYLDRTDSIEVRRILHPSMLGAEKYDISYAILVPSFSTVADYSGWLLSLYCCNNYSGFSGGMRAQAESFIKANKEHLAVDDITINLDEFRKYLTTKVKERLESPFGGYLSQSERESINLRESIELGTDMSAVIIELFVAVTMAEDGYDIRWQYKNADVIGNREIDVLATRDTEVQIIECSRHFPLNTAGIKKIVRELKRKEKLIGNSSFHRQKTKLRYITTKDLDSEPFKSAAQEFRKEGISAENMDGLLKQYQHKTKPIQELLWRIESLRMHLDK